MNFSGIIIGLASFMLIGLFHPIVIKAEYHLGTKCWWMFFLVGLIGVITSLCVKNIQASILWGIFAFSCFWSILELFQQKKRVEKGWFPKKTASK